MNKKMNRKNTHNKKRKIKSILFTLLLLAIAIGCIIAVKIYSNYEGYDSESEFKNFVDTQFSENAFDGGADTAYIDYVYGEEVSYAVDYSKCSNEDVAEFRDEKIDAIISEFKNKDEAADDEANETLLIKTEVHESENGVDNLMIYTRTVKEEGHKTSETSSSIYTYQFSEETGQMLVPQQIFHEGYKQACSDYLTDYFLSYYTDEQLTQNWKKYLEPTEENLNKFIADSAGIAFFFDTGTVLEASEGVVCAGVPALQSDELVRDKIIQRYIDPEKPMVAITFDDGPGLESEDRILNCLESNNAVATFFYQGMFIDGREDKIMRAYNIGCEIGNHTWNHPVLTSLKDSKAREQITKTNEAIHDACGHYPTVFRPSYGITSDKINKESELPVIMWSVDTLDWKSRNGKKVFNKVKKSGNLDGKIILMHSIHDSTADATELIIPWLKSQGYQIVTVSELIKYKTGSEPKGGTTYTEIR